MSQQESLERAVIGLALTGDPQVMLDLDDVTAAMFADPRHGAVWDLISTMTATGRPVDAVTVAGALPSIPADERRGIDDRWLLDSLHAAPAAATAMAAGYARRLADTAGHRRLRAAITRASQVLDGEPDPIEADTLIRTILDDAAPDTSRVGAMVADTVADTVAAIDQPSRLTPTPWAALNDLLGGWRPGALYVVGARPAAGKSMLGLQAAYGLAHHGPVAVSSLEMPSREVNARLLAHAGSVRLARINGMGRPDPADRERLAQAARHLASLPISVDDRSSVTARDAAAHARILARRGHLAGVVIDYLQLMSPPRGDRRPRHEIVADQSRQLKILAGALDCPVIALSQLNRASEARQDGRPTLADLRESGAIEQDADVVLLLHVPTEGGVPDQSRLDVLVAKNRHGPVGAATLGRDGATATLTDLQWTPRIPDTRGAR